MEAQENSQTEQNVQTPKKRELALVSRSTYIKEKALQWIFFACAFLAVVTVILIFVFTTYSALPVFTDIGLADFFSFTWAPSEGHYGIVSLLAGSGLVTVGALAMGVPLGVGTAVYLVEIAGKRVRKLISPAVDLLARHPFYHLWLLWNDHHPSVYRATDRRPWFWCADGVVRARHYDRAHHHDAYHRCSQFHSHGHSRGIVCHGCY